MSSFIISNKTMQNIINGLYWNHYFKHNSTTLQRNGIETQRDFKILAAKLYKLNAEAVRQRYREEEAKEVEFKWERDEKVDMYQTVKSMECLQYQCTEGTIPKMRLYKLLDELIIEMKTMIISMQPEYQKAKWDG